MLGSTTHALICLLNIWTSDWRREKRTLPPCFFVMFPSTGKEPDFWLASMTLTCMAGTLKRGLFGAVAAWRSDYTEPDVCDRNGTLACECLQTPQQPEPFMTDTEKQKCGMARSAGQGPGFKSLFCHLLTIGAWASYCTFLCLSFLIYKMKVITVSHRISRGLKEFGLYIKHLKKWPCTGTVLSGGRYLFKQCLALSYQDLLLSPRCPLCISSYCEKLCVSFGYNIQKNSGAVQELGHDPLY